MISMYLRRWAGTLAWGLLLLPLLVLAPQGTVHVSVCVQGTPTPALDLMPLPGDIFANSVLLLGYSLPTLEVPLDSELVVHLYWNVTGDVQRPYAVGMRLTSPSNGDVVWDYGDRVAHWETGRMVTEHHLRFSAQMRPGDYNLEIWLYDPNDGEYAPVAGPNRIPSEDRVRIAGLELKPAMTTPAWDPLSQTTKVPGREVVFTAMPRSTATPRP
ncbi:MAG TPA: hypothetical protein PLJ35_20540 [Anaerolineae bacterium]|nr:hypothetical protein [Anaerolineae bacterium]HOR01211.1 hypothetical protein [Anaerolineae bacterium]HPL29599.1 hypothetical protein [Anaerolineae bacterium]